MFQLGCCLTRRSLVPSQLPVANIVFIANPLHVFVYFAQQNNPVLYDENGRGRWGIADPLILNSIFFLPVDKVVLLSYWGN